MKKIYEMTVPELKKKRIGEQIVGIICLIFSMVFLSSGIIVYYSTGLLGPLILYCTYCILTVVFSATEIIIIQQINLYIYLKEHEK